jgi:PAS domain S-box-containing protein
MSTPLKDKRITLDVLLYPTSISFSGAENEWCAPRDTEIKSSNPYINNKNLSWATPFSDWVGSKNNIVSSNVELEAFRKTNHNHNHNHISFSTAETDFCLPYAKEKEIIKYKTNSKKNLYDNYGLNISFATPDSDFTNYSIQDKDEKTITIEEALSPSTQARVLTKADNTLHIEHVNEAWCRLCGYTNENSYGKTLKLIQGEHTSKDIANRFVRNLQKGKTSEAIIINYDKWGRGFYNHVKATPVISNDSGIIKTTHYLSVLNDIGEFKINDTHNKIKQMNIN